MNRFGLSFHHLGLAVRGPEDARAWLDGLGYTLGEPVWDETQRVNLAMAEHPTQPWVELVWPGEGKSPVDRFLKRFDTGVYHACYETPDLRASVAAMEAAGLRVISLGEPVPAPLFGGRKVWFHQVVGFGLIEMLEA